MVVDFTGMSMAILAIQIFLPGSPKPDVDAMSDKSLSAYPVRH
jgi:hypothetical protein